MSARLLRSKVSTQQIEAGHWHIGEYCLTFGWRSFGAVPRPDRGGLWFVQQGERLVHTADMFVQAKSWAEAQIVAGGSR